MKHYNPTIEGEITLPAFPSTRNDGVIPTNKILSTDASGNLKLYSIATAPAPFLDYVVPDSTLPSTTGNFQLHGSFFTPSMCLTANLATSIIFTGQTVNYAVFHSSNWIEVNITTGATEGSFAITLNNGLSATFNNAILIVLGTVFSPLTAEWTLTEPVDVNDNEVYTQTFNSIGYALWSKVLDYTKNFSVRYNTKLSPLGTYPVYSYGTTKQVSLINVSDSVPKFAVNLVPSAGTNIQGNSYSLLNGDLATPTIYNYVGNISEIPVEFRYVAGIMYLYINQVLVRTFTDTITENLKIYIYVKTLDVINIKYIELA